MHRDMVGHRMYLLRLALGLVAGLAFLMVALPQGEAQAAKKTDLKLYPYAHGVTGELTGPAAKRCFSGRVVSVFSVRGKKQRKLGSARVKKETGRDNPEKGLYTWQLKSRHEGRMQAKLSLRRGCGIAVSKTVKGLERHSNGKFKASEVPSCPARAVLCKLEPLHFDSGICPSFSEYSGQCSGGVKGPPEWRSGGGNFEWTIFPLTLKRQVIMDAYSLADMSKVDWQIFGSMSGPEKAEWYIENAYNRRGGDPNLSWRTVDTAIKPGEPGGPLYLDFHNGIIGADIHVRGYLYMKG